LIRKNNPIITGQLFLTNADVYPGSVTAYLLSIGNNDCFRVKNTGNGQPWVNDSTNTGAGNSLLNGKTGVSIPIPIPKQRSKTKKQAN